MELLFESESIEDEQTDSIVIGLDEKEEMYWVLFWGLFGEDKLVK